MGEFLSVYSLMFLMLRCKGRLARLLDTLHHARLCYSKQGRLRKQALFRSLDYLTSMRPDALFGR